MSIVRPLGARVIGLIPAAGYARRLSVLPMSKELFPLGLARDRGGRCYPKVASQYLLESMAAAGIGEAYVILRPGKWDIPAYFGDGAAVGMRLAYLIVHVSHGVPFTLDQAYPFVRGQTVAFGFPDMLLWPQNPYQGLLQRLWNSQADVVLGLFPTDEPHNVGVVDVGGSGIVNGVFEKSGLTHLPYMWAIAVWGARFTEFLHGFIAAQIRCRTQDPGAGSCPGVELAVEVPVGDVIQAGLESGLRIEAEIFSDGRYIDIGTPDGLATAIRSGLP